MSRVHILKETTVDPPRDWQLFLQWCRYENDGRTQFGYRFIWRSPDNSLQAARGQTRIPNLATVKALMDKADQDGWGGRDGQIMEAAAKRLEARGLVVNLATGYVGWSTKEDSMQNHLSHDDNEDARILSDWS